jgi:MerR HTH family regulatory protein
MKGLLVPYGTEAPQLFSREPEQIGALASWFQESALRMPIITVSAAAKILNVSEAAVRLMVPRGKLPVIRTESGMRLFDRAVVERLAVERQARRDAGGEAAWPTAAGYSALDLAPDGKRFAILPRPEVAAETGSVHVTFLLNFLSPK